MLQDRLLIRNQLQRLSAKEVERELREIQLRFADLALSLQIADAPPQPKRTRISPHPHLPFRHTKQDSKPTARSWHEWHFKLFEGVKRCKFSPDGNHLAIVSNKTIAVESTADIQHDRPGITREFQYEKLWADFIL